MRVSHNLTSSAASAPSVRRDTRPFLWRESWTFTHNSPSDSDVSPQTLASIRVRCVRRLILHVRAPTWGEAQVNTFPSAETVNEEVKQRLKSSRRTDGRTERKRFYQLFLSVTEFQFARARMPCNSWHLKSAHRWRPFITLIRGVTFVKERGSRPRGLWPRFPATRSRYLRTMSL